MTSEKRIEMRKKSRRLRGLLNLLTDDIYHVNADADDFDLICLEESLNDARATIQMFIDGITELEYLLYLSKQKNTREKHTPL